jgi:hypothetical protein
MHFPFRLLKHNTTLKYENNPKLASKLCKKIGSNTQFAILKKSINQF